MSSDRLPLPDIPDSLYPSEEDQMDTNRDGGDPSGFGQYAGRNRLTILAKQSGAQALPRQYFPASEGGSKPRYRRSSVEFPVEKVHDHVPIIFLDAGVRNFFQTWKSQGGLTGGGATAQLTKGCAYNVLTLYGIIDREQADRTISGFAEDTAPLEHIVHVMKKNIPDLQSEKLEPFYVTFNNEKEVKKVLDYIALTLNVNLSLCPQDVQEVSMLVRGVKKMKGDYGHVFIIGFDRTHGFFWIDPQINRAKQMDPIKTPEFYARYYRSFEFITYANPKTDSELKALYATGGICLSGLSMQGQESLPLEKSLVRAEPRETRFDIPNIAKTLFEFLNQGTQPSEQVIAIFKRFHQYLLEQRPRRTQVCTGVDCLPGTLNEIFGYQLNDYIIEATKYLGVKYLDDQDARLQEIGITRTSLRGLDALKEISYNILLPRAAEGYAIPIIYRYKEVKDVNGKLINRGGHAVVIGIFESAGEPIIFIYDSQRIIEYPEELVKDFDKFIYNLATLIENFNTVTATEYADMGTRIFKFFKNVEMLTQYLQFQKVELDSNREDQHISILQRTVDLEYQIKNMTIGTYGNASPLKQFNPYYYSENYTDA